jgi:pilus assembly protein FimV
MRKLSWIIAGILCTTPALIQAAELGNAKVQSHLTEQLKVLIPLTGLNGIPLDEVKIQLAPESYYRQAGLSLDQLAGNITFQIKTEGSQSFILMSSKQIITDPILSILVEVTSGESKVIKEFDLLLNPPVQKGANKPVETNFNNLPNNVTPAATATQADGWQHIKNVLDVTMGGDTLYDIAKRAAQGGSVSVRPMMQAIINANPAAFVGGNGNELKTGVTLKVPTSSVAKSTSVAKTEVTKNAPSTASPPPAVQPKLQLLSSDAGKAPAAANQLSSPPTNNTLVDGKLPAIDGSPTASTNPASAPASSVQQDNEAIASIDAKSQAMSQQIALLNEQLKQVQGLITDRNQNIESLQQKIKASDEQTQLLKKQLESQNNNFWIQWAPYLLGGAGLLVLILLLVVASRGRNRDQSAPSNSNQLNLAQNKVTSESTAVNSLKASEFTPKVASESQPLAAVAASVLPVFHAPAPPFDPKSIIDEARLLRSYNLNEQALDLLRDGVAEHIDELALYQELASIYAEDGNDAQLNQILAQIDSRFGPEHRPNVQNEPSMSAADSAPSAFDEPYSSPKMGMNDELAGFVPEPLDALDPSVFSNDQGLNFTSNDLILEEAPAPEAVSKSAFAADVPPSLDELTFDLSELEETKQPNFDPVGNSNDLNLELAELADEAGSADKPALNAIPAESALTVENTAKNDTRLGLAEAFLGVGDQESYRMIADEIESEGDADLIAALRDIELKYDA